MLSVWQNSTQSLLHISSHFQTKVFCTKKKICVHNLERVQINLRRLAELANFLGKGSIRWRRPKYISS